MNPPWFHGGIKGLTLKVRNGNEAEYFSGGMAEWFKAAVLKTVERKLRGFESYSLRHKIVSRFYFILLAKYWRDGRVG